LCGATALQTQDYVIRRDKAKAISNGGKDCNLSTTPKSSLESNTPHSRKSIGQDQSALKQNSGQFPSKIVQHPRFQPHSHRKTGKIGIIYTARKKQNASRFARLAFF
jgi:hypothetical protein